MSNQPPLFENGVVINDIEVPNVSVYMVRPSLADVALGDTAAGALGLSSAFPDGYRLRTYRPSDEEAWLDIIRSGERFFVVDDGLFEREFGERLAALADRMFLLDWTNADGDVSSIGTATAWFKNAWKDSWKTERADRREDKPKDGQNSEQDTGAWAQVHWVAIRPEHQGKGLSKLLMDPVMRRMAQSHSRAMLGTSTARVWAIKIYLDLGFVPKSDELAIPSVHQAWVQIQKVLNHPALEAVL